MKKIKKFLFFVMMFFPLISYSKIKVGITLLPYYSFVKNIVKDKMDVIPILPANADVHSYQSNSKDIKKLLDIDYIVVNGIGHDEFIFPMINTAKNNNKKLKIIYANKETTLMNASGQKKKGVKNPHTFISIQQAIEQVNYIAKELGKIDPKNKKEYIKNAINYSNKLRKIRRDEIAKVKNLDLFDLKIATTHAGYDYLLNEFGLTVTAVVEPTHGQSPNSNDLRNVINKIKDKNVKILFDEIVSNNKNALLIVKETGVKVAYLSHLTSGEFTADAFEKFIKQDLENISNAILEISKGK